MISSPSRAGEFIESYNRLTELGTLTPLSTESVRPSLVLTEITNNRSLLAILLAGGILNITLLVWVLLVIPNREAVSLGFNPAGIPRESLGSIRLILFPIINTTAYLGNLLLGMFLYRREESRGMAYILWGGSLLIGLIFHLGLLIILK